MLYCFQEKRSGGLLFSGKGNWLTTVLKEKGSGALLLMFSGEGDWCYTVLERRAMGLYFTLKNGSCTVPSLQVNSDESQQLVLVKFGKHFGFCFQHIIIGFISFI